MIVADALFVICWIAVLDDVVTDTTLSLATRLTSGAYPLGVVITSDVVLVTMTRAPAGQRRTLGLLSAGMAVTAVAWSLYGASFADGTYHPGSAVDPLWVIGFCGMASAAWMSRSGGPGPRPAVDRSSVGATVTLYVPIAAATVTLAHSLGLRAVAEGVENEAQLDRLRELGCDSAQGFYLGRPAAPIDLLHTLADGRRHAVEVASLPD